MTTQTSVPAEPSAFAARHPEGSGDDCLFAIADVAKRLGRDPEQLLLGLLHERFLYRYTGVGRPLAYVRWVRAGLFVNTATDVRVTRKGVEHIMTTLKAL